MTYRITIAKTILAFTTFHMANGTEAQCFAAGSYDGLTEPESDVSNLERLKNDEFDPEMKLSEISGCVNKVNYLKNL